MPAIAVMQARRSAGAIAASVEAAAFDQDLAGRERDGEPVVADRGQNRRFPRRYSLRLRQSHRRSSAMDRCLRRGEERRPRRPQGNRRRQAGSAPPLRRARGSACSAPSSGGTVTAASPRPNRLSKARESSPIMSGPSRTAGPSSSASTPVELQPADAVVERCRRYRGGPCARASR